MTSSPAHPTHVDLPWVTTHAWVAAQALRYARSLLDGDLSRCGHVTFPGRRPFSDPTLTLIDMGAGLASCNECFWSRLATVPDWADGRCCDGCLLRDALVTTLTEHEDFPELILFAALCEQCAPQGPVMDA